jgi:YVTN family beta-propeller protein
MVRAVFLALLTGGLLAIAGSASAQSTGTLVVANRAGGSISLIDLPTGLEIARLPIGPTIPHETAVSNDGRYAMTAEYGPNPAPGRHVVLIDIVDAKIVARIDLGPNSRPHSVRFHPDGQHAVATMQDSDQIALIDLTSLRVVATYPTGGREGHMVRLSPDGSRAYVTSRGAQGTLSVVFLDEDRPPVVIDTGPGAEGISVTPDGREVWVANRQEESISVIDTAALKVVAEIPSRPYAGRVEIGHNGLAVAPNGGGGGEPVPQFLRLFDVARHAVVDEVALHDVPGDGNFGVLVLGDAALVADPDDRSIRIFNLQNLHDAPVVLASAHESPDGLAWSPLRVGVMTTE